MLFSGCAGYRVGPTNGLAAGEKSIQVEPFSNQTLEPWLTDAVTMQVRKELQRDGSFRLATGGTGDIVMTGVITGYHRHELSFAPHDTLTVRDYRLSLTAQVSARDRSTGRMILDQPVTGYTLIRVRVDLSPSAGQAVPAVATGTDLTSSERQALPLLAGDLARNVASLLADGTW